MKKMRIFALSLLSLLCLQMGATYSSAEAAITEEKAKQIALQQVKGQIISVESENDDGMAKYEVKVQGRDGVYEVEIDKATGRVLEVEKEGHNSGADDRDDDRGEREDDDRNDD